MQNHAKRGARYIVALLPRCLRWFSPNSEDRSQYSNGVYWEGTKSYRHACGAPPLPTTKELSLTNISRTSVLKCLTSYLDRPRAVGRRDGVEGERHVEGEQVRVWDVREHPHVRLRLRHGGVAADQPQPRRLQRVRVMLLLTPNAAAANHRQTLLSPLYDRWSTTHYKQFLFLYLASLFRRVRYET